MVVNNHHFKVNEKGHLEIGGVDTVELAEQYGTPLYVYDVGQNSEKLPFVHGDV